MNNPAPHEEQTSANSSLAAIIFMFASVYLFIMELGSEALLSLKSMAFLIGGMFAAAILIGIPAHLLQQAIDRMLTKPASPMLIRTLRTVWLLIVVATTALAAQYAFRQFIL